MSTETRPNDGDRYERLQELFDALLRLLLEALKPGAEPNAQIMTVARRFLADNHITARSRADAYRGLTGLAAMAKLPFKAD
jgi:hypothetical protein